MTHINMQRTCIALIPALMLLMSIPLSAQTPDSSSSNPKYRVSVDLVERASNRIFGDKHE